MPKPVKLITWGTRYSEMLAEMGILEGEHSRFIRLLIDEAYRRHQAGNPVSVVDATDKLRQAGSPDKDVINQWNTRSAIRKEFCPNCEKETECEFTAELYECKECGEDFAKYIVSRSIENNNPDYYKDDYRAAATYPARSRKITHRSKGRGN